jgi:hypothetical protein
MISMRKLLNLRLIGETSTESGNCVYLKVRKWALMDPLLHPL